MKELIGKKISRICVNDDQHLLVFYHPEGQFTAYDTYGDCCSETWFADIVGVSALLNGVVERCDEIPMNAVYEADDARSRQQFDKVYSVKLKTDLGYVDIAYRNSSNGYYGGDIGLFHGEITENLTPITADWAA